MDKDYGKEKNNFRDRALSWLNRQVNEYIFDFYKTLPLETKILDVGCGGGFFLFFLKEFGFKDARGIDLSQSFAERCREKGLKVELADIISHRPDISFDLITMFEVLEHINKPPEALRCIYDLLKENGQFLITVPVCDSLFSRWNRLRRKETRLEQCQALDKTHIHAFKKNTILELVKKAGFAIKNYEYYCNPLPYRFRKALSKKTYNTVMRITFFNTCGEGLFIVAEKLKR